MSEAKSDFEDFKNLRYIKKLIRATQDDPQALNIMIWGAPGIGKSISIKEFTEEENIGFLDTRLSQLDSIDLRGFPKLDGEGYADFVPFKNVLPIPEIHGDKGILFLDEVNLASIDVMKAGYQLLTEKKIGGYTLPPLWRIVLAGNRPEDAPGLIRDLPEPLKNRVYHFTVNPPRTDEARQDLFTWQYKNKVHPSIIAFLKMNPAHIHDMTHARTENAWPSPRSWVMASDAIKNMKLGKDDGTVDVSGKNFEEIIFLVGNAVGNGAAIDFAHFTKIYERLPSARDILESGINSIPEDKRPGKKDNAVIWALLTSMVAYLREPALHKDPEVIKNYIEFLGMIPKEFAIKSFRDCGAMPEVWSYITKEAASKKFAVENSSYVRFS